MSFRSDSTRPGAGDGVSPPLAPSQGCERETTTAETTERQHEAGRWGWSLPSSRSQSGMRSRRRRPQRRRSDGTRPGTGDGVSPPLAPSQGCEQETTTAETTGRRHEAGCQSLVSPPPLSLPVRDASGGRHPQRRRSEGTRPGAGDGVSPPLAPSQGCKKGRRWRYHEGTRGTNK